MNIRKIIDYSDLKAALDQIMAAQMPQREQYSSIGKQCASGVRRVRLLSLLSIRTCTTQNTGFLSS